MANTQEGGFWSNSYESFKGEMKGLGSTAKNFGVGLQGTRMGKAATEGTLEALGWHYNKGVSQGFLGTSGSSLARRYAGLRKADVGIFQSAGKAGYRTARSGVNSLRGQGLKAGAKSIGGGVGRFAMKSVPGLFTAYSVMEGYQEGGVWGGIKGGAESVAMNAAFRMAGAALGGATTPLMIAAAAGYAGYKFLDAARDYGRNLKKVNMGAPIVDQFGTIATTRQRSLQALQNTHINGRMALGNEGMLTHTNVYNR